MRTKAEKESDRKYVETHREEIKERNKARYAARTGKGNNRCTAFLNALEEISDPDVREELFAMYKKLTEVFKELGNLKEYGASNQAAEFLSRCVWKEATAPTAKQRERQKKLSRMTNSHVERQMQKALANCELRQ